MEGKLKNVPLEVELVWELNTNKKELEQLRYYSQRQQDFWEWYESTHDKTNNELWDEFEMWEKKQKKDK
jgi:hypothetical protein